MSRRQTAKVVLNHVQMLDEQIAPARCIAEQRDHLVARVRINRTALRRAAYSRAPGCNWIAHRDGLQ